MTLTYRGTTVRLTTVNQLLIYCFSVETKEARRQWDNIKQSKKKLLTKSLIVNKAIFQKDEGKINKMFKQFQIYKYGENLLLEDS